MATTRAAKAEAFELVIGRQETRAARKQRGALGWHPPGGGELLGGPEAGGSAAPVTAAPSAVSQHADAGVRASQSAASTQLGWSRAAAAGQASTRAAFGPARSVAAASQARRSAVVMGGTLSRQMAIVAIHHRRRAISPGRRCARERVRGLEAAIIKTAILDQVQRRFEHRVPKSSAWLAIDSALRRHRGGVSGARCRRQRCFSGARGGVDRIRSEAGPRLTSIGRRLPTRRAVALRSASGNSAIHSNEEYICFQYNQE